MVVFHCVDIDRLAATLLCSIFQPPSLAPIWILTYLGWLYRVMLDWEISIAISIMLKYVVTLSALWRLSFIAFHAFL